MKRRRTAETITTIMEDSDKTPATSPESRLRRSKRSDSNPPSVKISRLQPSTPLHMTTRATSRAATESPANSVASVDSRRSSLADATAFGNGSEDEERPAKRPRRVNRNETPSGDITNVNDVANDVNGYEQSIQSSQDSDDSPRKRILESADILDSIEATPKDSQAPQINAQDDQDAATEEPTPARGGRGRRRGMGLLAVQAPAYTPSDVSAVNSPLLPPDPADEPEVAANGHAPEKPVKRLPGRRRAPHANVNIEADLRRQLSLKMGYRAIVKQLKPVLAELAQRSITKIDDEPMAYKESEHYQDIEDELAEYLRSRLDQLHHKHLYAKEECEFLLRADREVVQDTFQNQVRNLKEDYEVRAKYKILKALRANKAEEDADATADEDGPIPAFRAPAHKGKHGYILPEKYDSRSRFYRETDRLWDQLAVQRAMAAKRKSLIDSDDDLEEDNLGFSGFATYDPVEREAIEGLKRRQALLEAVDVSSKQQIAEDLASEIESRKTADGLEILATASEQRRVETASKQSQLTTPRTPKPAKSLHSRQKSMEERKPLPSETGSAPQSTKRRNSRAQRSRESSPTKLATPQALRQVETPRMSSNKIADLLNNDQPQQLHTIAELSPAAPTKAESFPPLSNPIKIENESRPDISESSSRAATLYHRQYSIDSGVRWPQVDRHVASGNPAGPAWDAPHTGNRPPSTLEKVSTSTPLGDRRASDSAAMRPKFEARPVPPPLDFAGSAKPTTFAGSAKPTTFDGSGSTISPTFARGPSFHSRTSSLGAGSGNYAQEARNAVVPPQMSSRRESQRDVYKPPSIDTTTNSAPALHPGEDPFPRRSEPSTPVERQYRHYQPPYTPHYPHHAGYQQPWHRQPPPPGQPDQQYHVVPPYGASPSQQNYAGQAGRYGSPPQSQSQSQPQERDVWRHHSYARGGRR